MCIYIYIYYIHLCNIYIYMICTVHNIHIVEIKLDTSIITWWKVFESIARSRRVSNWFHAKSIRLCCNVVPPSKKLVYNPIQILYIYTYTLYLDIYCIYICIYIYMYIYIYDVFTYHRCSSCSISFHHVPFHLHWFPLGFPLGFPKTPYVKWLKPHEITSFFWNYHPFTSYIIPHIFEPCCCIKK